MFFWRGTVLQDSSLIHFMTYFFPFSAMVWLSSMRQSVAGMLWQPGGTFQPNLLRWNIIRNELKQFVKNSGSKILQLMNMTCYFRNISWLWNFREIEFKQNSVGTLQRHCGGRADCCWSGFRGSAGQGKDKHVSSHHQSWAHASTVVTIWHCFKRPNNCHLISDYVRAAASQTYV